VKIFLNKLLLIWYSSNKRALPWRKTRDPYFIWISEIILQQTRIDQGEPYYLRFVESFPNIYSLASAREEDVLSIWQGLGYYTRARNMHKCARRIVNDYNGKFPESFIELKKLPGIGSYTAAAIASISFNEPIAVLDGNVIRVLSRYFGITEIPGSSSGMKIFNEKAQENIYKEQPGDYNQAIMEFGALQCTPVNPNCMNCALKSSCYANRKNIQATLPVKNKKNKIRNR